MLSDALELMKASHLPDRSGIEAEIHVLEEAGHKSVENLSSEHEIVVGANQYVKKGTLYYKGYFSGLIDDVIVEEQLLDDDQITDLCEQSKYFSA